MCVIVDNNVRDLFLTSSKQNNDSAWNLRKYIENGQIKLVVGGELKSELCENYIFKEWLNEQIKSGSARECPKEDVLEAEKRLTKENYLSNDKHVLALAKVSGAGLLFSHDDNLIRDYKNQNLGSVFKALPPPHNEFTERKRKQLDKARCRP